MFKLYVRPHLGYYVEFWIPQYAGDMGKIEKSQNKMTKLLKHGRLLSLLCLDSRELKVTKKEGSNPIFLHSAYPLGLG